MVHGTLTERRVTGADMRKRWAFDAPRLYSRVAVTVALRTMKTTSRVLACVAAFLTILLLARRAGAETLQTPVGGKPLALGADRIACAAPTGGWTLEAGGRTLRPPASDAAIGRAGEVKVAAASVGCGAATTVKLLTTGRWPAVDPTSLTVFVDEARAELRGKRLSGLRLLWVANGKRRDDTCIEPRVEATAEVCAFGVGRDLSANPSVLTMEWRPAGASTAEDAVTFDADGRRVPASELTLHPAKVVLATLTPPAANLDVSRGTAKLKLVHAEATTTVDCAPAFCDVEDGSLLVRGLTNTTPTLRMRVRLLPRVVLARGDQLDPHPLVEVPILRCPMTIDSGPPFADLDDTRMVVKLEGRCTDDARALRFVVGASAAEVLRVEAGKDATRFVLKVGRLDDEVTIRAVRGEGEGSLVAIVKSKTRRLPAIAATIELEPGVPIEFIPTNRAASVHVVPPGDGLRVSVVSVEGVYTVVDEGNVQRVRATGPSGGFVALRYAIRSSALPPELAPTVLGVVSDAVQRPMRQGNVPVPLGGIVELRCVDPDGRAEIVKPGVVKHIPFERRDSCYVAMNRARLRPEDGVQKLNLDIDVTRPDGSVHADARIAEPTTLRAGSATRLTWIHGIDQPFERVSVRVSHAQDDQHYAAKSEQPMTPAASQWSVVMGTSAARIYLTAAIPTVLYRVSRKDSSGILSLNFGVLGRLTWVDSEGHDGILALETGVTGVGLAPVDTSPTGQSLRQVATVAGLSIGVPIVNRMQVTQTSVNLHAWFEYEISRALGSEGSPFGFIFGPSITFGNVGTYL